MAHIHLYTLLYSSITVSFAYFKPHSNGKKTIEILNK